MKRPVSRRWILRGAAAAGGLALGCFDAAAAVDPGDTGGKAVGVDERPGPWAWIRVAACSAFTELGQGIHT